MLEQKNLTSDTKRFTSRTEPVKSHKNLHSFTSFHTYRSIGDTQ